MGEISFQTELNSVKFRSQNLFPGITFSMDSVLSYQTGHKQRSKMEKNQANSRKSSDKYCPWVAHKCKADQNLSASAQGPAFQNAAGRKCMHFPDENLINTAQDWRVLPSLRLTDNC